VDVQVHAREQAERRVARPLVQQIPKDVVVVYDRGFCGYAIPWLHQYYGSHCIIRLTSNFNPVAQQFIKSGKRQQIVRAPMAERAVRSLRKLGHPVSRSDRMSYRLIRVDLPGDEVEILLTTLVNTKRWPASDFKELYRLRWGVETCFHQLKSYFQATLFSSYKVAEIEQDLWALFTVFNLQSACKRALRRKVGRLSKRRQYNYQLNRNVGIGYLKRQLPLLLLGPLTQMGDRLDRLLYLLLSSTEPIRPRKNRTRKRRIMRSNERHNYESNYRNTL
jgi:23S rRNA G2069 N7-methylase RlmK/C1962 C5-methylase RlmI